MRGVFRSCFLGRCPRLIWEAPLALRIAPFQEFENCEFLRYRSLTVAAQLSSFEN